MPTITMEGSRLTFATNPTTSALLLPFLSLHDTMVCGRGCTQSVFFAVDFFMLLLLVSMGLTTVTSLPNPSCRFTSES